MKLLLLFLAPWLVVTVALLAITEADADDPVPLAVPTPSMTPEAGCFYASDGCNLHYLCADGSESVTECVPGQHNHSEQEVKDKYIRKGYTIIDND